MEPQWAPKKPRPRWVAPLVFVFVAGGALAAGIMASKPFRDFLVSLPARLRPQAEEKPAVYRPLSADGAVLIRIDVSPAHARLTLDGEPLTSNPLRLQRDTTSHRITASAEGFVPVAREIVPDAPKTVRLRLEPSR